MVDNDTCQRGGHRMAYRYREISKRLQARVGKINTRRPIVGGHTLTRLFARWIPSSIVSQGSLWFRWTRVANGLTDPVGDTFRMQMGNVFSNKLHVYVAVHGSPLTTRKSFSPGHWSAARSLPQSTFPNSINLSLKLGGGEREGVVRMNNLKQRSFYTYRVRRVPWTIAISKKRWDMRYGGREVFVPCRNFDHFPFVRWTTILELRRNSFVCKFFGIFIIFASTLDGWIYEIKYEKGIYFI